MDVPAIKVENVNYWYDSYHALKDLSFTVDPGEFVVLFGENGTGKTTLFSLLTTLYYPQSGKVEIFGDDIAKKPEKARSHMGIVFQERTLDLDLTVHQNLLYYMSLQGYGKKKSEERIDTELERLGMQNLKEKPVREISGGMERRLELARALLTQPKLLLFDESTVGLDIATRRQMVDYIHSLAKNEGIAVLWSTHLTDEIKDEDKVIKLGDRDAPSVLS